jgi:nitric oxide reductase NorQ protein
MEVEIVARESSLPRERCVPLVNLASRLRALKGVDLEEVASTRLLVYCAILMGEGLDPFQAAQAALIEPLCDEDDVKEGLLELIRATYG